MTPSESIAEIEAEIQGMHEMDQQLNSKIDGAMLTMIFGFIALWLIISSKPEEKK